MHVHHKRLQTGKLTAEQLKGFLSVRVLQQTAESGAVTSTFTLTKLCDYFCILFPYFSVSDIIIIYHVKLLSYQSSAIQENTVVLYQENIEKVTWFICIYIYIYTGFICQQNII